MKVSCSSFNQDIFYRDIVVKKKVYKIHIFWETILKDLNLLTTYNL